MGILFAVIFFSFWVESAVSKLTLLFLFVHTLMFLFYGYIKLFFLP